jgi:monovalent cation/proton antiporter MnhG/PhaG subunit
MSLQDVVVYVLLAGGVACEVIACLGVVAMRDVFDRLHYVGPAALGAVLVAAAVWAREGPSGIALKATLVAAFVIVASPALAHGTARAARLSRFGDWRPQRDEGIEVEGP